MSMSAALDIQLTTISIMFFGVPYVLWRLPRPFRRWLGE